jgi:hypothetical protein
VIGEPRSLSALPVFLRSRAPAIGLGLATAAVFAVGFVPLFDTPGYEIALAAGLIVPSSAAIATALELAAPLAAARRSAGEGATIPEPFDMLGRGIANGAAFGVAAYLTTLIHGARTGFCDLWTGTWSFALGPLFGAILGGAWGAVAAAVAGRVARPWWRRTAAVLAALLGPLTGVAVSLWRFFASPMVFAYDPFAGYFSGTIYDTVIDASGLITYRAGSFATLGAAIVLSLHLRWGEGGALRLAWRGRAGVALAGALCALASAAHIASGTALGHHQTPGSIASALGARAEGARCTVLHPRGMRADEVSRFVRDCDAHVRQLEAWFEGQGPDRITVYLFADVQQKDALMGAAETQIAKPWRREVYVQAAPYPHQVIGHELAHVVAGSFARGPFRTAGDLGGLVPDPGLVEGVAVAAAPREGDLSPLEWARAMKDLGILPKLDSLFTLGFLGANSSVAYTVSGAFVEYIKNAHGAAAVRRWYGGEPLPAITSASWPELEARFHATLDALPLSEAARAQAKARFDRPGIFGRRCPHVVDACRRRADALKEAGDEEGALEQHAIVRALDPNNPMVRVHVARSRIRKGELTAGKGELRAVVDDERAPRHVRDRALEDLADLELAPGHDGGTRGQAALRPQTPGGDGAFAAAAYREIMSRTVDEDMLRTLEVKAVSVQDPRARRAMFQFLIGDPGRGPDRAQASEMFGLWSKEAPDDGMPDYLMARQLQGAGLFTEAAERLDAALAKKLALPRVQVEALRLRTIVACALGDPVQATKTYDAYRARPEVPRARRESMAALVARCTEAGQVPAIP